jgi:hypothetical protein
VILETLPKSADWYERHILSLGYREIGEVHHNHVLAMPDVAPGIAGTLSATSDRRTKRRARRRAARGEADSTDN